MTPSQLKRREALLTRNDAALERWPQRTGQDFTREMTAVVQGLEALTREVDAAQGDRLERSRNWRFVGTAYFDLANAEDLGLLKLAADAYKKAEALLAGVDNAVEKMKLDYSYGHALFRLSDAKDLALVQEARRRYASALEIARAEMPAGVEHAKTALANADRIIALLTQAEGLSQQIAELESQKETVASEDTSIQDLFGLLEQQLVQEKSKGNMDAARQSGLGDLMERLGKLVAANERPNQSLEEMTSNRGKLDELMTEMMSRIKRPTFSGPQLPEDSRGAKVLALLLELKAFVAAESMKQQMAAGETQKAMDLFARVARLTTRVHETRGDEHSLVSLETDQARSLANEVQWYARRHYLTLARPVWSHGNVPLNPNLIFFSGPEDTRRCLERAAARIRLEVNRPVRLGEDVAESRWQDLRAASLGVLDISSPSPQVFYELGIALTLGTELLLVAERGTDPPFDIAQNVHYYSSPQDLESFLASALDEALYGLQCRGSEGSSVAESIAYAGRLAEAAGNDGLLRVALESLRKVGSDPVETSSAFKLLNVYLGERAHMLLYPRWPGVYPDMMHPRCFVIMPFRDKLNKIYQTIVRACKPVGVHPVRGDEAPGQEIIKSIWEEIGRGTHVIVDLTDFNPNVCLELGIADTLGRRTLLIAMEGTDKLLEGAFPSISKRRCHTYPADPSNKLIFMRALTGFLNAAIAL